MILAISPAVLGLILSCWTIPAWAGTENLQRQVQDIMTLSGLQQQIQQVPQQVLAGFDQQRRKLPVEQQAALRQALATSFDATMLEGAISKNLEASLRPNIISATLNWLKSDLGRKVTGLENSASEPRFQQELPSFAKQLEKAPPDGDRVQLIRRIDQASHGTEMLLDISESLGLGVAAAYEETLPAAQRSGLDHLRNQLARSREARRQQIQNHVWISLLLTYRTLPQEDLRRYVEFLETEEGLGFYTQANLAIKESLEISVTRISRAMIDILKPPAGRKAI